MVVRRLWMRVNFMAPAPDQADPPMLEMRRMITFSPVAHCARSMALYPVPESEVTVWNRACRRAVKKGNPSLRTKGIMSRTVPRRIVGSMIFNSSLSNL